MSKKSLAKSEDEYLCDFLDSFYKIHPWSFRMEDAVKWGLETGQLEEPDFDPTRQLTIRLKQAACRRREKNPQGVMVKTMLSGKFEYVDEYGQKHFEIMYDYLHTAEPDFLLVAFKDTDERIAKQRLLATRNVQSVIDNNPSVKGHEEQFRCFAFMLEEPAQPTIETVEETPVSITKKKPR